MSEELIFHPIIGNESHILSSNPYNGYMWFAVDTKKIYYSNGEEFLPMGGNSSIFYGKKLIGDDVDIDQVEFEFALSEIDGNEDLEGGYKIPNIDDLILNSDGCFYRVVELDGIEENTIIHTMRLTLKGGGGGGTGSDDNVGKLTFKDITPRTTYCLYGSSFPLEFSVEAIDAEGIPTGNGTYAIEVNGVKNAIKGTCYQGKNSVEIGSYLKLGENKIRVYVTMDIGGSGFVTQSKLWNITASQVEVKWNYNESIINDIANDFTFNWSVSGYSIEKTTHIIINDLIHLPEIVSTTTSAQSYTIKPQELVSHGAHKVEMYVTAKIGDIEIQTPSVIKNIIFADSNEDLAIISCSFFEKEIRQYDTVKIPIIFYHKDNLIGSLTATLKEDNVVVDEWKEIQNGEVYIWNYTPTIAGRRTLTIQCAGREKILTPMVMALDIDNEEVSNYAFRFKASEFISNATVEQWVSGDTNITATFSNNFDWINGGLKSELDEQGNLRQYVCVKADTTMTINYNLFATTTGTGKSFKFIFKATNCEDYNAKVLEAYDKEDKRGLIMRAQSASFNTSGQSFNVPYCENSYIEFELDITKADSGKRYITAWLDGVPTIFKQYTDKETISAANSKIIIGSPDCDVYVYLIKAYERHLEDEEHLKNFIADAPNAQEMIARYDRNDIIGPTGAISPTLLALKNPNCRVHVYDIPRMTLNKNDPVDNCTYVQYHGSDTPVISADNVTIKVQGTSSAAYGLSAFNLDSKFNNGFVHADGSVSEGWSMNENSIPVNYFCTKVNVASAEHTNNAINQEWYNKYQPYKTQLRAKNEFARDTMEFTPGVLFIKDHNPQKIMDDSKKFISNNVFAEIDGYDANAPYERMYSICNMGNSKKNIEVLHDTENPVEYCVEVTDNQKPLQWMTHCDYEDSEWEKDDASWKFRYPDGYKKLDNTAPAYDSPLTNEKVTHRQHAFDAWRRFITWMAESNPQPAFKEEEIKSQEDLDQLRSNLSSEIEKIEKEIENLNTQIKNIQGEKTDEQLSEEEKAQINELKGKIAQLEIKKDLIHVEIYTAEKEDSNSVELTAVPSLMQGNIYEENKSYFTKTSNPYGYTNAPLESPVTAYEAIYEFGKNEDTAKYVQTLNKNGIASVGAYAKTFTHDTYEYRMAKMLHECEDYLVMDSVLFHYLFIERHTMIDNVAKNTFWSTEDGYHWNLTKNYDNDTSDGNDNEGKLTLTYGLEPLDSVPGNDQDFYFNANQSVWLRFCGGLYEACRKLYNELESTGVNGAESAWDADAYLTACSNWQKTIPERCWIEDYYRKYIRPLEIYNEDMFADMLEGGQKTHQRKQFETYQDSYISSKYNGKTARNNRIILRGNGNAYKGKALPVSMYADCYIQAAFGAGDTPNVSMRVKGNETVGITVPDDIKTMDDATIYFYSPHLYQTIGTTETSLNIYQPKQLSMSPAVKLKKLIAGNMADSNSADGDIIVDQEGLTIDFTNNTLLETLHICNYPNLDENLDLSSSVNLKELDARNSGFTGVSIADGAPLQSMQLEGPTMLWLSNLKQLETFNINNPNNITELIINNIDNSKVNSKTILNMISEENIVKYQLKNVQWTITEDNELINDKDNIRVQILNRLLQKCKPWQSQAEELATHPGSLTGKLTINTKITAEQAEELYTYYTVMDSLNINEETKKFPGLDINFSNLNGNLYTAKVLNGNGDIIWSKKFASKINITTETLEASPQGPFDNNKVKKSSTEYIDYDFNNQWIIYDAHDYAEGKKTEVGKVTNDYPLISNITQDIIIEPQFDEKNRAWNVIIHCEGEDKNFGICPAGKTLQEYFNELPYDLAAELYKNDSGLALTKTYTLEGFSLEENSSILVSLSDYKVLNDVKLYTVFKEISVYDNIHENWFTYANDEVSGVTGKRIARKSGVNLKGKITLPAAYNGSPVIGTSEDGFKDCTDITHIFIGKNNEGKPNFMHIRSQVFQGCTNLQYFEFPPSLLYIHYAAFRNTALRPNENNTYYFGDSLKEIGLKAFNQALDFNNDITIHIPASVTTLDANAFVYPALNESNKIDIQIGDSSKYSELNLAKSRSSAASDYYYSIFQFNYPKDVVNNLTFYSKNYNSFDTTVVKDGKSHSVRDWLTNGHRKDAEWNIYHQSGSVASET